MIRIFALLRSVLFSISVSLLGGSEIISTANDYFEKKGFFAEKPVTHKKQVIITSHKSMVPREKLIKEIPPKNIDTIFRTIRAYKDTVFSDSLNYFSLTYLKKGKPMLSLHCNDSIVPVYSGFADTTHESIRIIFSNVNPKVHYKRNSFVVPFECIEHKHSIKAKPLTGHE